MAETRQAGGVRCAVCGESFSCGAAAGSDTCWCMEVPAVPGLADPAEPRCLCPGCLRVRVAERLMPGDPAGRRG